MDSHNKVPHSLENPPVNLNQSRLGILANLDARLLQ